MSSSVASFEAEYTDAPASLTIVQNISVPFFSLYSFITSDTNFSDSLEAVPEANPVANEPIVWIEPVSGEIQKRYSEGELMYSETMNDYKMN